MSKINVTEIEKELEGAREAFKDRRKSEEMQGGWLKTVRFYHNSKTRHNGILMTLDNGQTVYKEFKEADWLNITATFTRVKNVAVWYDKNKIVQQFILSHDY
ncbi:MAG: hypothetical protein GX442_18380 [Candidatus Riflebacteria bacterium]|nr:hypothetical protein [Candidatus Riflebacteria bacterium]